MFIKYVTNITSTQFDVIRDLMKLATGSAIADLSTSANKSLCSISGTTATGWTEVDYQVPVTGQVNGVVASAKDADNITTKYVMLASTGASKDAFAFTGYETFNPSAHIGTNATATPLNTIPYTPTGVNTYYIFATPRLLIMTSNFSERTIIAAECAREAKYLKNSNYPVLALASGHSMMRYDATGFNMIRQKLPTAAGDGIAGTWSGKANVPSACVLWPGGYAENATNFTINTAAATRDQNEQLYHPVFPLYLGAPSLYLGMLHEIYGTTYNFGTPGDEVVLEDGSYAVLAAGTMANLQLGRYLVRKD